MYVVGFLFVYFFLFYNIKKGRIKLTIEQMSDIMFIGMLGVLVGARLGYVLFYKPLYYLQNPLDIFKVWEGGMSFHGGLIFTLLFSFFYLKKKKINFLDAADVFVLPTPIAVGLFGRWGNFVNGELWGRPTLMPWGMIFDAKFPGQPKPPKFGITEHIPKLNNLTVREIADKIGLELQPGQFMVNLPRHPSQLYELLLEGVVLFLVMWLCRKFMKKKPRGFFIAMFVAGYGLARFFVEFFREPDAHLGYLLGTNWLTMGMVLSFPMFIGGAIWIYFILKKGDKNLLWAE
jgi:phosphatidylglycerol:prolipoprotein diacylglycerol transferase